MPSNYQGCAIFAWPDADLCGGLVEHEIHDLGKLSTFPVWITCAVYVAILRFHEGKRCIGRDSAAQVCPGPQRANSYDCELHGQRIQCHLSRIGVPSPIQYPSCWEENIVLLSVAKRYDAFGSTQRCRFMVATNTQRYLCSQKNRIISDLQWNTSPNWIRISIPWNANLDGCTQPVK